MHIRQTTAEDLPHLYELFLAAIGELYSSHGFPPPAPPLAGFVATQAHILETDPDLCRTAEDDDGPAGFASAWSRGDDWFLASLFVAPRAQRSGLGSQLLTAVWGERHDRRRTITDSIQPVSNALYARRGLVPVTPLLTFSGEPRGVLPPQLDAVEADLSPIDRAAYGFDRRIDHAYWRTLAPPTLWAHGWETVAYSYAFPWGDIGPIAATGPEPAAAALAAELARATGRVRVRIPGSARIMVETAIHAGLQLEPVPGLLLLSAGAQPPDALAPSGYPLF